MHQNIRPRKSSRLKQPNPINKNASNNGRNVDQKPSLPVDAVRVIVTATDPKYNSHVFLRVRKDRVESIKKDWCRLENMSLKCVDFFCGNRSLPNDRTLSDIEESYPGIIDIICVPSTKGLVRILVDISDEAAPAELDPLIFLRPPEDLVLAVKLDVARALNVESTLLVLQCEGAHVFPSAQVGHLTERWPGIVDLKVQVLSKRDASVQCHIKDHDEESQTEISSSRFFGAMSLKKTGKTFPSEPVRLRIGSIVTFHTINPSDTLGAMVDEMRSSNLLMSVSDVKVNDSSLWSPSWMERPLQDFLLSGGEELVFQVEKQVAHVELYTPPSLSPREWTLDVPLHESCWASIAPRVPELRRANKEGDLVVVQYGLYFLRNGFWRRAVHSLNINSARKGFYAELDGEPVEEFEGDQLICELLTDSSGIRGTKDLAPILTAFSCVEVLRPARCKEPQLQRTDCTALFDPRALLLFRGLRLRSTDGRIDRLFLLLAGAPAYCDLSDGSVQEDVQDLSKSYRSRWSEVFIVLFEGEVLPRWPIPFGRHVRLLRRHGVDIQVACDRRIRKHTPTPRPTRSDWTRPTEVDHFLHSVSSGIRRLLDHQFG